MEIIIEKVSKQSEIVPCVLDCRSGPSNNRSILFTFIALFYLVASFTIDNSVIQLALTDKDILSTMITSLLRLVPLKKTSMNLCVTKKGRQLDIICTIVGEFLTLPLKHVIWKPRQTMHLHSQPSSNSMLK